MGSSLAEALKITNDEVTSSATREEDNVVSVADDGKKSPPKTEKFEEHSSLVTVDSSFPSTSDLAETQMNTEDDLV